MSRHRRRLSNKTRRILRRLAGWTIALAGIAGTLGAAGAFLSHMDVWTIDTVHVSGTEKLEAKKIKRAVERQLTGRYLGMFARQNALIYPAGTMRRSLKKAYPRMRDISFSLDGLNALRATIRERRAFATLCLPRDAKGESAPCLLTDKNGFAFATTSSSTAETRLFIFDREATSTDMGARYRTKDFSNLRRLVNRLEVVDLAADTIEPRSHRDYRVMLRHGGYLRVNLEQNVRETLRNLRTVLENDKLKLATRAEGNTFRYIDLRFGDRVFYKYATSSPTSM
jgi:cell division septal protein FtsQ